MINHLMVYGSAPHPRPNKGWATRLGSNLVADIASPLASFLALCGCLKVISEEWPVLKYNISQFRLKND
ncbi:MAG: hypothetical protein NT128_05350 [Proteobacteria bacterium]|nr:hypothetical protein [Pseudomonadota bacterium]